MGFFVEGMCMKYLTYSGRIKWDFISGQNKWYFFCRGNVKTDLQWLNEICMSQMLLHVKMIRQND